MIKLWCNEIHINIIDNVNQKPCEKCRKNITCEYSTSINNLPNLKTWICLFSLLKFEKKNKNSKWETDNDVRNWLQKECYL